MASCRCIDLINIESNHVHLNAALELLHPNIAREFASCFLMRLLLLRNKVDPHMRTTTTTLTDSNRLLSIVVRLCYLRLNLISLHVDW